MKHVLLHPTDSARLDGKPIDGVTIEADKFGVTKPGEWFLVDMPDPLLQCMPIRLPQIGPERDFTLPSRYPGSSTDSTHTSFESAHVVYGPESSALTG